MAYTTTQVQTIISTLEGKLTSGIAEIQADGMKKVYRSTEEIQRAITYFQNILDSLNATATGTPKRSRVTRLYSTKALS